MAPDRGPTPKSGSSRAWQTLNLSEWIVDAMAVMGFDRMTPVQASTIPLFMANKDVVVEAVTGSGKTLAFLIPTVERLLRLDEPLKKHHIGAIVLAPTRELAIQIHTVLCSLLQFHAASADALKALMPDKQPGGSEEPKNSTTSDLKVVPQLLLGGSTTAAQDLSTFLKTSPNLLVATPGRLLEMLTSPYVHCPQSSFEALVMDEADRLLDLGFKDDLTKILNLLPKQRRTGLFSASVSEAVDQIIRVGLRNPVKIAVRVKNSNGAEDKRTPASLQMTYVVVKASQKFPALSSLLQKLTPMPSRVIVYLSTCAAVDYFQSLLPQILPQGMILVPLHGKHPANVRQKNFLRFTDAASPALLLTTDVAARGLDIPSVDLVVQIDPPSDPKVFLHRCGRAGRAGRRGLSVVFLQPGREEDYISFLDVRQTPIEELKTPEVTPTTSECDILSLKMMAMVKQDRAVYDKAQKAFVSWLRSYSKHQASSIFRIADLDWVDLAKAWALLRLPKMPELKGFDRKLYDAPVIDWDTYAYKDKQREKHRKLALEATDSGTHSKSRDALNKKRNGANAWSQNVEDKATREIRRSRKAARREHDRVAGLSETQKLEEAETRRMIGQVRLQQVELQKTANQTFEGFD